MCKASEIQLAIFKHVKIYDTDGLIYYFCECKFYGELRPVHRWYAQDSYARPLKNAKIQCTVFMHCYSVLCT